MPVLTLYHPGAERRNSPKQTKANDKKQRKRPLYGFGHPAGRGRGRHFGGGVASTLCGYARRPSVYGCSFTMLQRYSLRFSSLRDTLRGCAVQVLSSLRFATGHPFSLRYAAPSAYAATAHADVRSSSPSPDTKTANAVLWRACPCPCLLDYICKGRVHYCNGWPFTFVLRLLYICTIVKLRL